MNGQISQLVLLLRRWFARRRNALLLLALIAGIYGFAVAVYHSGRAAPPAGTAKKRLSNLYLQQFLAGYRNYQLDFSVEDIYFGEAFLYFRVDFSGKPGVDFQVRHLAGQIIADLNREYPELDLIEITFSRRQHGISYGIVRYAKHTPGLTWRHQ